MYAVIGANGYLGSYVIKAILENTEDCVIATSRNLERVNKHKRVEWICCDIQSFKNVDAFIDKLSMTDDLKIVYLAAYHHPDLVEKNKYLAWDINVTSFSRFISKTDFAKKFYYTSTDSVYGNSIDGYHFIESDPLNPVNFYGHNKCVAESIVIHLGRNVVRFPFLISPSIIYKPHFYDEIVNTIRRGEKFEMFEDSFRSTLSFENAGNLLVSLMEKRDIPQVVNICGDKGLSKYEVGVLIAEKEGINPKYIVPVSCTQLKDNFIAQRATSTLMDNHLLKQILALSYIDVFKQPERI